MTVCASSTSPYPPRPTTSPWTRRCCCAEAGAGGELLRVWEQLRPAVVLGAGCRLADEVDEAACRADGVPILRRSSGGGTVLLGPGCLLYTLVLDAERAPELAGIRSSYRFILGRMAAALAEQHGVEQAGISDLAAAGRKFSGNAQQRKRRFLLHHGTLLYAFDPDPVGRYLLPPARQPEYRAGRDHAAFLRNLDLPAEEIKAPPPRRVGRRDAGGGMAARARASAGRGEIRSG